MLIAVLAMDPVTAVAHGLLSFLLPGVLGAASYWRRRNRPSWFVAVLLCAGTVPGLLLGRWITLAATQRVLQIMLAAIVLAAGLVLVVSQRRRGDQGREPGNRVVAPAAASAGLVGGLSTVLAGVGGPLVTVPVLTAVGLDITPVVGAALLNSVFGVALGAATLIGSVRIDVDVLVVITGAQLVGVLVGARLHDRLASRWLGPVVSVAAVATGGWLLLRALMP
jgi:uncharacterized membrane protein YfcA